MLAADVWCFLARLIPPDESFQQFKALVLLLKNLPHYCATKAPLFVLVGRLFSFLLPHHQEAIVSTYSMKSNFALWESLSSSGHQFSAPIMIDSCQTCVTLIDGWVGNGGCLGDSCDVVSCLNITHNLLQSSNITDELHKNLSLKQSLSLLNETLQSLWLVLPTYIQVGEAMTELLKHLLRVSTSFIKWMFNFNLSLVTCKVLTYLQNHPNAVLTCEVAKFLVTLESLGSKMVGNETKIKLWKQVICDATKNWLSQHKVFNEMELFSRLTRNPSNINLICAGSNNLELLKSHLQRIPVESNTSIPCIYDKHRLKLLETIISNTSENRDQFTKCLQQVFISLQILKDCKPNMSKQNKETLQNSLEILNKIFTTTNSD
uniref:Uncharacterized protein n=3 Tax=Ciona intestinalis TaxID=7719 RepID=F6PHA9_CIOIN